ncbi:MAG: mandelate racemase/muconate lactonizing enzyme family protein [Chloroflexi bacterium]|nr:mandelate racemase/muconate lactonizing enzyme family protein [Chloroflexota bacterium]MCY4246895.1 mandelate racemase/muconate lactonizing enzyme family protein [Chloroflexota bacterium]
MKIIRIDCHVLLVPEVHTEACSSAQDNLVVEIHTDEGISGIGETDVNPWIARACIQARGTHIMGLGLEEMLLGEDPLQPEAIWRKLYSGSKMNGRRGALICAMGAIDMALWDIKGKALGLPVYKLLGGAVKDRITPYASLLPTGETLQEYRDSLLDKLLQAQGFGFKAAKLEICINGPYTHNALQEHDDHIAEIVADCRAAVGAGMTLMVDVAYAWGDARTALRVINQLLPYDLFFLETPINIDDLDGYAFIVDQSPMRIAAGEWQNTHFEFIDLAVRGKLDVLQPDIGRVGGFTEARKVAQLAEDHGRLIVPHCWKTGIGIAASAHLGFATACCPFIEYLPAHLSESALRDELVADELQMIDGEIPLPQKPGLGIEINREALEKYRA